MTDVQIAEELLPVTANLVGGRDITSSYIADEVSPNTHPLSKNSKIVIAPGYLTQFAFPCAGRLSVGAKSPLTHGIKESNVGGTMSKALSDNGISAVIIEGTPNDNALYVLYLSRDGARLDRADNLRGKGNQETLQTLRTSYGDTVSVLTVGRAGDYLLPAATIACTDTAGKISRHAGRGGLGAVMGAKGVKAIVVNTDDASKTNKSINSDISNNIKTIYHIINSHFVSETFRMYGTNVHADVINALGAYPTRCFSEGSYEMIDKVNGDYLRNFILSRGGKTAHYACSLCGIGCSNIINNSKNEYVTSALEYETICAFGANCGIHDMEVIAEANRICNDIGVDTIETGVAVAVAMRKTGVLGKIEALKEYLNEIEQQTVIGRELCSGVQAICNILNEDRIPTVKKQAIPMYDPRSPFMQAMKITYATSPMGADHTAGYVTVNAENINNDMEQLSKNAQYYAAAMDAYGICMLATPIIVKDAAQYFTSVMSMIFGRTYGAEENIKLGKKIIAVEESYNKMCGFDNYSELPSFMHSEALPPFVNTL